MIIVFRNATQTDMNILLRNGGSTPEYYYIIILRIVLRHHYGVRSNSLLWLTNTVACNTTGSSNRVCRRFEFFVLPVEVLQQFISISSTI